MREIICIAIIILSSCQRTSDDLSLKEFMLTGDSCKKWHSDEVNLDIEFCSDDNQFNQLYEEKNSNDNTNYIKYEVIGSQEYWKIDNDSLYLSLNKNGLIYSARKISHISDTLLVLEPNNKNFGEEISYRPIKR